MLRKIETPKKAALFLCILLALPSLARAQNPAQSSEAQIHAEAIRGLNLMMDGDLNGAIEVFHIIRDRDPQSPLGYLLEADAMWWRIYYATANLIDPDVFAATDLPSTPYDAHFDDLVNLTIRKSEEHIRARQDLARNYLYEGMAYALRARLTGLRDQDLPTARAGKKMRALLLKAAALDPNLTDAYLGLGIYNYFVDTLSAIVKILAWFIRLPGGSRVEGLRQLELVAEKGELARSEAKFYLAKDYSRWNERQYARSLKLFEELKQEYPHNPLWPMLIGSLYFKLEERQKGEETYREVYQSTAGKKSEVDEALHKAAREALRRLHPDKTIE